MDENTIKNVGWIYCIKSNEEDTYKCGKVTNLFDRIQYEKHLKTRYGIIIVNPEIICLSNVSHATNAEKDLFKLLENIKLKRELYKTSDINEIIYKMNEIGEKYILNEDLKYKIDQYKNNCSSNINTSVNNIQITPSYNEIISFNTQDRLKFIKTEEFKNEIVKLLSTYTNDLEVIKQYNRKLFLIKQNQCIKKTNLRAGYSKVHIGNNRWETILDKDIYPKVLSDIANDFSKFLKENQIEIQEYCKKI